MLLPDCAMTAEATEKQSTPVSDTVSDTFSYSVTTSEVILIYIVARVLNSIAVIL